MTANANADAPTVRLTIPARAEYISLCRLALTGIGRLRQLSVQALQRLSRNLRRLSLYRLIRQRRGVIAVRRAPRKSHVSQQV